MSSSSRVQRPLVTIANLVALVLLCGDTRVVVALSLFMALAGALTMARPVVPERARRAYVLAGVVVLTVAIPPPQEPRAAALRGSERPRAGACGP